MYSALCAKTLLTTAYRSNRTADICRICSGLFYLSYPQVEQILYSQLPHFGNSANQIWQSLTDKLQINKNQLNRLLVESHPKEKNSLETPPEKLINRLSFTHLAELLQINDPLKRTFYEIECIKGNWSVRELRRQINSLYYERSGLSKDPQKLSASISEKAELLKPIDIVKSVYTFEFLGLNAKDVVEESHLETALLDNLQQFMLELGHGFCLEARQKRILIGDEYNFIDLLFYHRVLKCHVLVDLKIEEFTHASAGQLNTYLNYYKKEMLLPDDNPPVGILLVTNKNETLVEYATAGMDNQLFVSKYLVELPAKEQLENFVQNELKQL
jgi:predicted nuclease of restriction endonuclease-like (RecB) superfamily